MELYVDIKFLNNSGDGSQGNPFGTITEAAQIALREKAEKEKPLKPLLFYSCHTAPSLFYFKSPI